MNYRKCLKKASLSFENRGVLLYMRSWKFASICTILKMFSAGWSVIQPQKEVRTEEHRRVWPAPTSLGPYSPGSVHAVKCSKKVQDSTFFYDEYELVTFAPVVKVWERWLCSSSFLELSQPLTRNIIIRNFKKFLSGTAVALCE